MNLLYYSWIELISIKMHSSILVELKKFVFLAFLLMFLLLVMVVRLTNPLITRPVETELLMEVDLPVHNIDSGKNFSTIQEAINDNETLGGHTIFVEEGTYYEHVFVDKSISLIGENRCNTILDGNETGDVVDIFEEKVSVSGFRIQHGEVGIWAAGPIGTEYPMEINISNNLITSNGLGLGLCFSHNSTISDNIIHNNSIGILLSECLGTVLRRNNLTRNDQNLHVGSFVDFFVHNIDTTNTIDGKPIYYWVNQHDRQFPADAGYVAAVNSVGITVENLTLRNNGQGVLFANTTHSTIKNVKIYNCNYGVALYSSNHNTIVGNIMSNGEEGIRLETSNNNVIVNNTMMNNTGYEYHAAGVHLIYHSQGNTIRGNTISGNYCGIRMTNSNGSIIYHNNLVNNTYQVLWQPPKLYNIWDNGFEGNYWSNYTGQDLNGDGIGDNPYVIDVNNQDSYPLLGMFSDFKATPEYCVQTICNSSISDFQFNETAISFNVSGEEGTTGFCRICIPTALIETYKVFVNGTEVPHTLLLCSNSTHSYLYFTYNHSTQEVIIVPEFPTWTRMLLILVVLTVALAIYKRRLFKTPIH